MLHMVVEHFRNGDAAPVYRRVAERALLDEWMSAWSDLVEFELIPVITSPEAAAAMASR
jgi:hypothetical protein